MPPYGQCVGRGALTPPGRHGRRPLPGCRTVGAAHVRPAAFPQEAACLTLPGMPGPYRSVTTKKQAARPGSLSQSLFFDHHIRGLVQIAAAHADDEVAFFGVLPDPGGGTL